jgi:acetylornithine deacetylase/succinyl-diaminopimelate desuccinylase-like protein
MSGGKMPMRNAIATTVVALALFIATTPSYAADDDLNDVRSEIAKRHDEAVKRLQEWIGFPSIAAEDRNYPGGAETMAKLARDAGFQQATVINTSGKPGVFGTLDAGAAKTVGLYFMYDVKQFDPAEWTSPPLEARLVDKPGLGKVIVGRGAVNQKGPQAAFLAALHAIRGAGRTMPVNLVLIAEGEEEIGSPHIGEIVHRPEVEAALRKCVGVFMPAATQDLDGIVTVSLGAKGVVELELVSSGEKWGRGPGKDIHSSLKAMVDSPAWHLVKALDTLVSADGNTITIDGYPKPRPLSADEKAMIAEASKRRSEAQSKKSLSVQHWIDDLPWQQANERLESQPTVNIEGLVGGYTGPGGKTVLPHRAVAKIDMRLVPDMKKSDAVAALKAHLAKRGFGDIEVNVSGGYDPTSTPASVALIQAQVAVLKSVGINPVLWPRNAGSYPGYVFTGDPLKLASGHFGLGHGSGAHAPDEYYVIESANPKVEGFDGAALSFVEYCTSWGGSGALTPSLLRRLCPQKAIDAKHDHRVSCGTGGDGATRSGTEHGPGHVV